MAGSVFAWCCGATYPFPNSFTPRFYGRFVIEDSRTQWVNRWQLRLLLRWVLAGMGALAALPMPLNALGFMRSVRVVAGNEARAHMARDRARLADQSGPDRPWCRGQPTWLNRVAARRLRGCVFAGARLEWQPVRRLATPESLTWLAAFSGAKQQFLQPDPFHTCPLLSPKP